MPASSSYSSMLPKFPDKQRRPGIIHLPAPIATSPRPTTKLPALNPSQKHTQKPENMPKPHQKANVQLRTPSPSPRRHNQSRHRQKRSNGGNVSVNIADISGASLSVKAPQAPSLALMDSAAGDASIQLSVPRAGFVPLSPPPTPKIRAPKPRKGKARTPPSSLSVRRGSRPSVLLASPPLTPEATKVSYQF